MAQSRGWFSRHSRALRRAVLILLGMVLAGFCAFAAWFYIIMTNPPPASHRAVLVDLDNDGDLDAVLANGINEGVSENTLWINQGGAQRGQVGFFVASDQRLGRSEYHNLAAGDLDGDGDMDLLFGCTWNELHLFTNQGGAQGGETGRFGPLQALSGGSYWGGLHPTGLGDLDGDGDLDILSGNCCGGLMMRDNAEPERLPAYIVRWTNTSGGSGAGESPGGPQFQNTAMPVEAMDGTEALALGDLDGDGDLDAFLARTAEIYGPDNSYRRRTAYRVMWNDGAGGLRTGDMALDSPGVRDLALGDLDGDGDLDALAATPNGGQVIQNQGGAQLGAPGQFAIHPQMLGSMFANTASLGDLDGDGDLDALLVGWSQAQVWLNDGFGDFRLGEGGLRFSNRSAAALGDVDGDGDLDIFAARLAEEHRVWRNDGKGKMTLFR